MSQSQSTILERAKHGDAGAIAALMNRSLQPKGITARVIRDEGYLQIYLESEQAPQQTPLVEFSRKGITGLGIDSIHTVQLYGMQQGRPVPIWEQTLQLKPPADSSDMPSVAASIEPEVPLTDTDDDPSTIYPPSTTIDSLLEAESPVEEAITAKLGVIPWLTKNWLLIPVMATLAVIGFLVVVFLWNRFYQPQSSSPSPAIAPTPASTPEKTTAHPSPTVTASSQAPQSTATSPTASPTLPTLNQAYKLGMAAAVKTQTAITQADWKLVIADWQQAIQLLKATEGNNPQATTVQQKIREYQRNLNYAQERLAKAKP